jgi:K+-sensing histidine kinase KdpD
LIVCVTKQLFRIIDSLIYHHAGHSRDLVAADNTKAIVSITCQALAALFQVPVVVMLVTEGTVVSLGDVEPQKAELEAARSSVATGTVVRGGVYPDLSSRFDFWPVTTAEGQNAVIGLAFDPDERPSAPDALVDIVGSVLALVLDRQHVAPRRKRGCLKQRRLLALVRGKSLFEFLI